MSLHRVFAARFWGIEIRPSEHDARVLCEDWVWRTLLSGVRSSLAAFGKIEAQFATRGTVDPEIAIIPDQESEAFERLMVDILDDGGLQARQAPLLEDSSRRPTFGFTFRDWPENAARECR